MNKKIRGGNFAESNPENTQLVNDTSQKAKGIKKNMNASCALKKTLEHRFGFFG